MPVSVTTGSLLTSVITTGYVPRSISQVYATDLNNDGNTDLLVLAASYPSNGPPVAQPGLVAFGDGAGGFKLVTESQFPISTLKTVHSREVIFSDFNRDGIKDVYIANHGYDANPFPGEQNRLYLSNSNATWRDATLSLPQVPDFSHGASVGDVNGDGNLDLIVGNVPLPNPVQPYMLLNDGNGNFTRNNTILPTAAGQLLNGSNVRMTSELLSDLDNDGKVDLVVGSFDSTASSPKPPLILWNTSGRFSSVYSTTLPSPRNFGPNNSVYDIQTVDLNRDGRLDLLIAYQNSVELGGWELQVLMNTGNRSFSDQTERYIPEQAARFGGFPSTTSPESQYWVQFIKLIDINSDGRMDFVLDARGITSAPLTFPVAYVQQNDGSFQTAKVGDIAGSQSWLFDYTTQAISWSGTSGFVKLGLENGTLKTYTLPTTFAQILPLQADLPVVRLDIEGNAGQTYRVYKAAFNRTPDNGGLKYWIQMMDGGKKLSEVASGFIASNEFKSLYGANPTNDQFVSKLYNNVLGRSPDAGGFNYWVGLLDNKQIDMTSTLVNFSESTENKAAVIGTIQNGIELV